jgi:hypothetical protein
MRIIVSILVFVICFTAKAQEFNFGGTAGFNVMQHTSLDTTIYSPPNSYHTYIAPYAGARLIDHRSFVNGLHLGGAVNFIYKRLGVYWEPQFYYQRTVFQFDQPIMTERVLAKKAFRMPLYFTYKFFKKERSMFSIIGLSMMNERNWDFQNPGVGYYLGDETLYDNNIDLGDDHFEGVLYNDETYWNLVLGLGKKLGRANAALRYVLPMGREKRGLSGDIWSLEMSFNFFFLSTKEITQKHHLYFE